MSQAAATSLPWSMAWLLARANLQREPLLRFAFPLLFSFPFFPLTFLSLFLFPLFCSSLLFFSYFPVFFFAPLWVCLKIVYPIYPMVLLIIIPIKWLFHWEYTLFSFVFPLLFCPFAFSFPTGLRGQGTSFGLPGRNPPSLHLPIHRGPIRAAWRGTGCYDVGGWAVHSSLTPQQKNKERSANY